ncbi:DNA-binding NarL/FixJ family response regulator [Desulfobaculum xiamenense]|uniref:DNA-binding NarL/FixJ family response regulator n=1 Tax=Desulfobaculum xiamenense TaxID=995050 RepID=A0A846QMV5_9BACT|nr:response regulator [Desulfobaculum xiamenense]NJB67583.1 DNA-binding NarL/FixJ family response regulator [Desulfobaculum xiamenense]
MTRSTQHTEDRHETASAVILAASMAHARMDADFLRRCGVRQVAIFADAAGALEHMQTQVPTIVMCDEKLEGTSGLSFVASMQAHPSLADIPVLMVSADAREEAVLDAIAAGCAGYLLRPYSMQSFQTQLDNVRRGSAPSAARRAALARAQRQADDGELDRAIARFEEVVNDAGRPEDFYERGCMRLARRDWDGAIVDFRRAVTLDRLYAEAYEGLGKAWAGKGNEKEARKYMRLAAAAYSRMGRYSEARTVFVETLKVNPESENPFLDLGFAMVRRGDWTGAGRAYAQAMELCGSEAQVYEAIARASHFTDAPEHAARQIVAALTRENGSHDAERTLKRILGDPARMPSRQRRTGVPSVPSFIPDALADAWMVLRYTLRAYHRGPVRGEGRMSLDFS